MRIGWKFASVSASQEVVFRFHAGVASEEAAIGLLLQ